MNKSMSMVVLGALAAFCTSLAVQADPTGTTYDVSLSGTVRNAADQLNPTDTESYMQAGVPFDTASDPVAVNVVPDNIPPYIQPLPLSIGESITYVNFNTQRIGFRLYGTETGNIRSSTGLQSANTFEPLFDNPLQSQTPVIFQVSNLFWQPDPVTPIDVTNVTVSLGVAGGNVPSEVQLFGLRVAGAGSQASKLSIGVFLDAFDFISLGAPVTSLHLTFDIITAVPEPASLGVMGVFALVVLRRRTRGTSQSS